MYMSTSTYLLSLKDEILRKLPTITGISDILYYQKQLKFIENQLNK